jgi:quercetin dioxygenase-like cupin family protein
MENNVVPIFDIKPTEDLRNKIYQLQSLMIESKDNQVHIEPTHNFANGMYARGILIPRDVTIIGKIHKYDHICIISKGEISVITDDGMKRIKAPATFVSTAGAKRAMYAHEDSEFIVIHSTKETDVELAELDLVCETEEQYLEFKTKLLEDK